jgi:hypothetical protein
MGDRAAASLLRGVGKASWRFVGQVAASFVATLCVTLFASGWLHSGTSDVPTPTINSASSSPSPSASFSGTDAPLGNEAGANAKAASFDAPGGQPAASEKETLAATRTVDSVPVSPAALPRARPTHGAKAAAHNAQPSCAPACLGHSGSEPSGRVANLEPPRQPLPDPQAATSQVVTPEENRQTSAFGFTVPALAVPAVFTRSLRPVLHGASTVTGLLAGLTGKP